MKTDKTRRKITGTIISLAFLAAAVAGAFLFIGMGKSKTRAYTQVKAAIATDSKVIEASGNIESIRKSDLSFASVGLISAVYVSQGQKVRSGEALAALDDSEQRYNYLSAQQKLEQYRLTGNIRQAALAELELAMQKTALDRAKITAPFAGFISSLDVEPGEYVANGKVAMTLVDRSTLVATLQIDEVDIPMVRLAQRVVFTFDALGGRELDGMVSQIPPVGKITTQGLAVFDVEAKIDSPPDDLLPGFSFSAQIIVREPQSYLSVPWEALVDLPAEKLQTVQTRGKAGARTGTPSQPVPMACLVPGIGGKPETREFLGLKRLDGTIAVLEGIAEGDIILVPAVQKKTAAAEATGTSFRIPGLGGPPPGGQQEGNRR